MQRQRTEFLLLLGEPDHLHGRGDRPEAVPAVPGLLQPDHGDGFLRADMSDTVAHEYGHHLQHLTGILRASSNIQYDVR